MYVFVSLQVSSKEEEEETPLVLAVTIKDEHGNIDLGAIAESECSTAAGSTPACVTV